MNWEITTFIAYFVILLGVALVFYFNGTNKNSEDFFLGGRSMGPWVTALSAQASDMSAWLLMGLPGSILAFGFGQMWIGIGLAIGTAANWILCAKRLRTFSKAANDSITLPQYLTNRFAVDSRALQLVCALIFLFAYTIYVASALVAGTSVFTTLFPDISPKIAMFAFLLIIVAYTFFGGFAAVCWTDFFQGLLMMAALMLVPIVVYFGHSELLDPTALETVYEYTDAATGAVPPTKESFSSVFGRALTELAEEDPRVCAITAAMEDGTGITPFAGHFPDRFFDVGIAEGHAAAMAAGLAKQGALPVFAVYSSFLQRAYDQLLHDVALSGLHVVFAVDRAGLVGADGATHHGVMDTVFLSGIPNMTVLCPASFAELRAMLRRALFEMTGPVAIRYPRGGEGAFTADTSAGDFAELRTGKDITLCAYGTLINNVLGAAELLHEDGIEARVVKLNRISPFRGGELSRIFGTTKRLLVAEECSGVGCIGQRIAAILAEEGHEPQRLMLCNLGRRFIEQGSVGELYRQCGLDAESLARTAKEVCQ